MSCRPAYQGPPFALLSMSSFDCRAEQRFVVQFLIAILGVIIVLVGLYFGFGGRGESAASGGARGISLEDPAWLVLVAIGVGLVIFGASADFVDRDGGDPVPTAGPTITTGAAVATSTEGSAGSSTTTTSAGAIPVAGCQVTVDNPLVTIFETPSKLGRQIMRIPAGVYTVSSIEITEPFSERWFRISVADRDGWIKDSTFDIASKSPDCP